MFVNVSECVPADGAVNNTSTLVQEGVYCTSYPLNIVVEPMVIVNVVLLYYYSVNQCCHSSSSL